MLVTPFLLAACAEPTASPVAASRAAAAKSPPKPTFQLVTTTVYDRDAGGNVLSTRADDHDVSGFAVYTESGGVTSHMASDGSMWQLLLANQQARRIHLAVAETGFPAPDGYYYDKVEVYARCLDASGAVTSLLSMSGGDSNANCTFGLDFAYNNTKYKLVMGQQYGGTGRAVVACTSTAGAACSSWTIVPDANAANAGVAALFRFASNGSLIAVGMYHNSYSLGITKN